MIGTPEKDDNESRIYTYSIVGKWSFILAVKYKRLCENKERINSIKGYNKFQKREVNTKVNKRLCRLHQKEDI